MNQIMQHIPDLVTSSALTWPDMGFAAAAIFFAGTIRAFSGFGFAMALVPLLALIIGPAAAIPLALLLEILNGVQMLPAARKQADWSSIWLILPTALLAAPFGVYLLVLLDADSLRILIALALLGAVALMGSGLTLPSRLPVPATLGIGAISGLLAGSTAMAGPPVLIYFLGRASTPDIARASMFMYFPLTSIATLSIGMVSGIVALETLLLGLMLSPVLFASNLFGSWAFHRTGDHHYRRAALIVLTVIALGTLTGALV